MKAVSISVLFGFSAALGAMIWLLSHSITGQEEPWDAESEYYRVALVIAGFIPASIAGRRPELWAAGTFLGQLITFMYLVLFPSQPVIGANLWLLGLFSICLYSSLSFVGALLGVGLHQFLRRRFIGRSNAA